MNLKIDFLKFKKQKKFEKKDLSIDVNSRWKFLLYICLLVIIFGFIFGFFVFREVSKDPVLTDIKNSNQMEKVKRERVQKLLDYFTTKEQKTEQILLLESPVIDPSR